MIVGQRLRQIREQKKLSQGDIERKTGLLRCYISRVENGHTVPNIETLQKFAHALDVPLYQLFYESDKPPDVPDLPAREFCESRMWGSSGKDARVLEEFRRLFRRLSEDDLGFIAFVAHKMQRRKLTER